MTQKTIAFLGASTGVGLSTLRHALAAGHTCIALCRTPSKLSTLLPPTSYPNLTIISGNAHDPIAVTSLLKTPSGTLVDEIVFSIGGAPKLGAWGVPTIDDPQVCETGMRTVLSSLADLRAEGVEGKPLIVAVSTIGLSRFGRDIALAMIPVYAVFVRAPRVDKRKMEDLLTGSGERWCIVRPSHLVDGASERVVRVGIEHPETGVETREIGVQISREDCGKWIAENLVVGSEEKYLGRVASITW